MRVFVAGATGAIGRQLVQRLVAAGHEVHGMTRSASKQALLDELGAVPVVADALDPDQVAEAVGRAQPDVIVHQLTAMGAVDTRHMERAFALTNRLRTEGTDHLLSAAQAVGVRRFVAQSHIASYARTGAAVKREEDPYDPSPVRPMRPNLEGMRHLEAAVLGAGWTDGIVLRYGWFYGPGTSLAPGAEQLELIRKRKFPLVGDGAAVWSFIHVADAAEATVAAIEHGRLLLESLSPEQRAALLLHDVFDYGYPEIAAIVGKSEANVRQLATRARRHVEQRRPRFQTTRERQEELARRFFAAAEQGDLAGLETLLAHDVSLTGDGGGKVPALARTLHGRDRVARTLVIWLRRAARIPGLSLRRVEVNGGPGAVYLDEQQRLVAVLALDIAGGDIAGIRAIVNPDKLTHLGPLADYAALLKSAR